MIRVYAVNVGQTNPQTYETLYKNASQERKLRADKCRQRENAYACIAAEALLRYAVKNHLHTREYTLEINAYGKPRIKENPDFHFNISHSGNWVVLACGNSEVGIDVETLRMDEKKEKVARRFFSDAEQQFVFQTEEDTHKRFFQIWTAKESYLKFLGTGLQTPLTSFDVCTMTQPHFFTHWLEEGCMTLCSVEKAYQMELLQPEQLMESWL